ncbi:MAG: high-potential iron-sulfur protein [Methylocystis sp.]
MSDNLISSRRAMLQTIVGCCCGGMMGRGMMGRAHARGGKSSQAAANYRGSPRGGENCANCAYFQAPRGCAVVSGSVSANGWCRLWRG